MFIDGAGQEQVDKVVGVFSAGRIERYNGPNILLWVGAGLSAVLAVCLFCERRINSTSRFQLGFCIFLLGVCIVCTPEELLHHLAKTMNSNQSAVVDQNHTESARLVFEHHRGATSLPAPSNPIPLIIRIEFATIF